MHSTENRVARGPSNILFACVHVSIFQPGSFTGWGSGGVKFVAFGLDTVKRSVNLCHLELEKMSEDYAVFKMYTRQKLNTPNAN